MVVGGYPSSTPPKMLSPLWRCTDRINSNTAVWLDHDDRIRITVDDNQRPQTANLILSHGTTSLLILTRCDRWYLDILIVRYYRNPETAAGRFIDPRLR